MAITCNGALGPAETTPLCGTPPHMDREYLHVFTYVYNTYIIVNTSNMYISLCV